MKQQQSIALIISFMLSFSSILKSQDTVIAYNNQTRMIKTVILSDGTKIEIAPFSCVQVKNLNDSIKELSVIGRAYIENQIKNKNAPYLRIGESVVISAAPHYYITATEYSAPTLTAVNCNFLSVNGTDSISFKDPASWVGTFVKLRLKNGEFLLEQYNYADFIEVAGWRIGIYTFNNVSLAYLIRELERIFSFKMAIKGEIPKRVVSFDTYQFESVFGVLDKLKEQKIIRKWKQEWDDRYGEILDVTFVKRK